MIKVIKVGLILIFLFYLRLDILCQFGDQNTLTHSVSETIEQQNLDIDNDGDLDIVVASYYCQIAWYENLNDGSFGPQQIVSTSLMECSSFAAADLDQDDDIDLFGVSGDNGELYAIWNLGEGVFESELVASLSVATTMVEAVDFDADGDLDILCGENSGPTLLWLENSSGNFDEIHTISEEFSGLKDMHVGDINGDGMQDILLVESTTNNVCWLENEGGGGSFEVHEVDQMNGAHQYICCADINGDSALDIIAGSSVEIVWFPNLGDESFDAKMYLHDSLFGIQALVVGDVDQDEDLDICLARKENDSITCLENNGIGSFSILQEFATDQLQIQSLTLSNLYGSSSAEMVSISNFDDQVQILKHDNQGNFESDLILDQSTIHGPRLLYHFDVESDGDDDIVVVEDIDRIGWFENLDNGLFDEYEVLVNLPYDPFEGPGVVEAIFEDFDGDSDIDLVTNSFILNTGVHYFENENGQFNNGTLVFQIDDSDFVSDMTVFDYNEDSLPDLVVSYDDANCQDCLGVIVNLGNSLFDQPIAIIEGFVGNRFELEDFNNDSIMDVLTIGGDQFQIYPGNGWMTFDPAVTLFSEQSLIKAFKVADISGNGFNDIAYLTSSSILWYSNHDNLIFEFEQELDPWFFGVSMDICDYDQDADLDILCVSQNTHEVDIFENLSQIEFGPRSTLNTKTPIPVDAIFGDVDDDGDPDIIVASYGNDEVSWIDNTIGEGCTDQEACNYSNQAWIDNGSCFYPPCINWGDSNGDGIISVSDILDLLSGLGCQGVDCPGDLNNDGVVDVFDLLILLGWFGLTYP